LRRHKPGEGAPRELQAPLSIRIGSVKSAAYVEEAGADER